MRLNYTSVANPRFANAEGTLINCEVVFPSLDREAVPFTAAQTDPGYEHSEEIFARCVAGQFGPVAAFVDAEVNPLEKEFGPVAPFEEVPPVKRRTAKPAKQKRRR